MSRVSRDFVIITICWVQLTGTPTNLIVTNLMFRQNSSQRSDKPSAIEPFTTTRLSSAERKPSLQLLPLGESALNSTNSHTVEWIFQLDL